jgi:flavin-dependent dehydrogenase
LVARARRRLDRLGPGSRIAVIGGGPAGSSFAIFALHYAREANLDLEVTIFEPRDFSKPGPQGCNMCAGLIPIRSLRPLVDVGVTVPEDVIQQRIEHYTLHTVAGPIPLPQTGSDADVISVYRGSGPRNAPPWPHDISFDRFLLESARSRGADVVAERVTAVTAAPDRQVVTATGSYPADLVVLAAGVNRSQIDLADVDFRPPPRQQMIQVELFLGADGVRDALGGSVHVVLAKHPGLAFGTLIPKGTFINVSLLGTDLPADSITNFLALPEVERMLASRPVSACSCRPRISVGPARPLFADRFVAVGDAGVTRLYKNGIGSAIQTAEQAARTAVLHGVSDAAFRRHYAPLCRAITRDNLAGRFLFSFSRVFRRYRWLTLPHLHSVVAERSMPPEQRHHSRFLWAMFTGAYPYRQLLGMALRPRIHLRLLRGALTALRRPEVGVAPPRDVRLERE